MQFFSALSLALYSFCSRTLSEKLVCQFRQHFKTSFWNKKLKCQNKKAARKTFIWNRYAQNVGEIVHKQNSYLFVFFLFLTMTVEKTDSADSEEEDSFWKRSLRFLRAVEMSFSDLFSSSSSSATSRSSVTLPTPVASPGLMWKGTFKLEDEKKKN